MEVSGSSHLGGALVAALVRARIVKGWIWSSNFFWMDQKCKGGHLRPPRGPYWVENCICCYLTTHWYLLIDAGWIFLEFYSGNGRHYEAKGPDLSLARYKPGLALMSSKCSRNYRCGSEYTVQDSQLLCLCGFKWVAGKARIILVG
jgi:hypothetical protein